MRAAVLTRLGDVAIQDVPDPVPAADEILIRTEYAGICGSDLHAFRGEHPFRKPPVVLGHEVAGRIVETGCEVRALHPGDRVTVMPLVACGTCPPCRAGRQNICLQKAVPGAGAWLGTFAEYVTAKASVAYPLSAATPSELGVLAEPLAVGIHGAFRQGAVQAGGRVLVLGAGPIGLLTAIAARAAGAAQLALTDLLDFNLRLGRDLAGATGYNTGDGAWEAAMARAHPEKFDVAFLCSSAPATVAQALAWTRRGGRIVVTGMFHRPVPVDLTAVNLNELELVGSVVYDHDDFRRAVRWLEEGRVDFRRLVTHVLPLARAQDGLRMLSERTGDIAKILLRVEA
jgi:L-iditol 2-dehydrogenase